MTNEDIKTVRLVINSEQAAKRLDEINSKLETARQKKQEAFEKGDAKGLQIYSKEIQKLEREQRQLQTRSETVAKVLKNLDKATPNELRKTIKEINKELNSGAVERGSEEWNTLTKSLREANEQLKKIKAETQALSENKSWSDRFSDFGLKWVGIITTISQGIEVLTGVKQTVSAAIQSFAQMQEAENDVRKYTGMTTEEVAELNEEFKRMDTRSSREQLNALAADAGRLGIQGKETVMDFVEAADMINIALGEDLGEDAVKNIGKLAQLFGDADSMGLKGAMLATASAINDLGQTSSASEGYIVDFTGRLAGAGAQANMTQAQIMALGAVLDQSMVNAEEGSTALSKIIQKIYREPQKVAQAAGLDVAKFTKLVKEDANEALLQFATAVSQMGGMEKIAPMLGDMSLTGAGVSKTLMALAGNIDLVRETQLQATQSFAEGISVMNEYNMANNTVQAGLEKDKGRFNDLRVELGEKLIPVQSLLTGYTSKFINVLITLIDFTVKNSRAITYAVGALALYTVAVNASVIADKAKVFWSNTVLVSLRRLYTVLLAHPWGMVAAAVAAFVGYMQSASRATDGLSGASLRLKRTAEEAAAATAGEKTAMESLLAVARDENRSKAERETAIRKLNALSPEYLGNLTLETIHTDAATKATRRYVDALLLKKKIELAQQDIHDLEKLKDNAHTEAYGANFFQKAGEGMMLAYSRFTQFMARNGAYLGGLHSDYATSFKERGANLARNYQQQIDSLKQSISEWTQLLVEEEAKAAETAAQAVKVPGGAHLTDEEKRKQEQALQERNRKAAAAIEEETARERLLLRQRYDAGLTDYRGYTASLRALDI